MEFIDIGFLGAFFMLIWALRKLGWLKWPKFATCVEEKKSVMEKEFTQKKVGFVLMNVL